MKYFTFLFVFFCFGLFAQLQNSYYPNMPYTDLYALDVADNYIYAAGSCDVMMISQDGGNSWNYIESIGQILDIDIVPGSGGKKVFVMLKDKIFLFDVETREFQKVSDDNLSLNAGYFRSLIVNNNSVYLISNSVVHKATAGENIWTKVATFDIGNDFVRKADITENYIWVTTNKAKILKMALSDNKVELIRDFNASIQNFDMANDSIGYFAVSGKTYLQKTIDGGQSFSSLINMPESISPLAFGENVVMTINTNRMYISMDGGKTSNYRAMPNNGFINLVFYSTMTSNGILYMAGKSGMVLKSEDFGTSFENLTRYKREDLLDIEINASGKGYAIGGSSTILYTGDNGSTWEEVNINSGEEDNYLNTLVSIGDDKFLIGHNKGISLLKNKTIVSTNPVPCDLLMKSKSRDYVLAITQVAGQYVVSKSADSGMTWSNLISLPEYTSDLQQSPEGKIFIPGVAGKLIVSEDNGTNWQIIDVEGIDKKIWKLKFFNDSIGLLSTGKELYLTKDGGKTVKFLFNNYKISNLHLFSDKYFMATSGSGNSTVVRVSKDQGENWSVAGNYCFRTNYSFYDGDQTVWLAQVGGHINKVTIDKISVTKDFESENTFKVFPNPVVSGQKIDIEISASDAKLEIIEASTGRIIKKLSNISQGYFDTTGLKSGVYILKLNEKNNFKFSKMIVVN